jgi:Carboxypeptidase regulatory-like domain
VRLTQFCSFFLPFLLVVAAPQQPITSAASSLSGTVLDGDGKHVPGATVRAVLQSDYERQFPATTDASGNFTLTGLPEGTFYLLAFKVSDGYPESFYSFFSRPGMKFPWVSLKEGAATEGVVIRLGAKAARINLNITSRDGTPQDAALAFTRPDMPESGSYKVGVSAKASVLVPPVPFRLAVEAKGFKSWHYEANQTGLISLKPGEILNLSVRLEPIR